MRPSRFNSLPQLAAVMTGFVLAILLLESEALATWAERLDVGPARARAVAVTAAIQKTLRPLQFVQVRRDALDALDLLGWTDDPARLLAARQRYFGPAPATPCPSMVLASLRVNRSRPAAPAPVPTGIPSITPLAPLPALAPGAPRTLALVGDSMMAVGLSDTLLRETAGNPNLRVIRAFKSGTGLARPDVFDWMQEYPAMIAGQHPDAILVAIGANDGQGFVDQGKVLAFGTDAWVRVYQQRTEDFLNLLTQDGARVVWVGLPPMQSPAYNQRAEEINRIAYSVVGRNPLATWWNPQPLIAGKDGGFRDLLSSPDGKTTRIRQPDGIHLSDDGAALLTPSLMEWLNAAPPLIAQASAPGSAVTGAGGVRRVSGARKHHKKR